MIRFASLRNIILPVAQRKQRINVWAWNLFLFRKGLFMWRGRKGIEALCVVESCIYFHKTVFVPSKLANLVFTWKKGFRLLSCFFSQLN
jgi:hypothetical protein